MALERIKVGQGDGPILKFRLQERLPDGTRVPYLLSGGASAHFIGKTDRADPDANAVFNYTGTILLDGSVGTFSEVDVTVLPTHTAAVKTYFAKLVVTKGGANDTVKQVWFEVSDT